MKQEDLQAVWLLCCLRLELYTISIGWLLCRVVSAEEKSLKSQAQMMSEADIVVMTHGAAMGNIMFMAPVSEFLIST